MYAKYKTPVSECPQPDAPLGVAVQHPVTAVGNNIYIDAVGNYWHKQGMRWDKMTKQEYDEKMQEIDDAAKSAYEAGDVVLQGDLLVKKVELLAAAMRGEVQS